MPATTLSYTGAVQTYTVPSTVSLLQVELWGAQGGASGGLGGYVKGTIAVTPGETLNIYVGQQGTTNRTAAFNGGAIGGSAGGTKGGGGGGGTDVRRGGTSLAHRVMVAGGGGGKGWHGSAVTGGAGGGLTGGDGQNATVGAGKGGTQSAGGRGALGDGTSGAGSAGVGDVSGWPDYHGGGGGGGYWGGGGGTGGSSAQGMGGGGGSSYLGAATTTTNTQGSRSGNGQAILTPINNAPNAPALTTMADGATYDRATTQRASHTFSDPDGGDTQSKFDLRYRLVGAGSWTDIAQTTTSTFYDFAANALAAGDYERQVRTYDALGDVGPYSSSGFFTMAATPTAPTIVSPANNATVGLSTATFEWSTPAQDSYQVRKVADSAGSPNTGVVYYDSGEVVSSGARSVVLSFPTNSRAEHLQVRVKNDSLWSAWASVKVNVSYTGPAAATVVLTSNADTGTLLVAITNPAPGGGAPAAASHDVYVDDGDGEERKATNLAPGSTYTYWTPRSLRDYEGHIRVVTYGSNGTTTDTTA